MSLLKKLGRDADAAERKVRETSRTDVGRAARGKAGRAKRAAQRAARRKKVQLKRKAVQDVRRAEEEARRGKDELARQLRQDIRTASRQGVRGLAAGTKSALANVEFDEQIDAPETTAEVVERAGNAATVRSPMNATLDPGTSGPAMEAFAMATPMNDGSQNGQPADGKPRDDGDLLAEGFIAGGSDGGDSMVDVGFSVGGSGDGQDLESQFFGDDTGNGGFF